MIKTTTYITCHLVATYSPIKLVKFYLKIIGYICMDSPLRTTQNLLISHNSFVV